MALWNKRKKKQPESAAPKTEVLYVTEAGDDSDSISAIAEPPRTVESPSADRSAETAPASADAARANVKADQIAEVSESLSPAGVLKDSKPEAHRAVTPSSDRSTRRSPKRAGSSSHKSSDIENWRKGVKGRPTQVFIGFLANGSKHDAIKYAIGVAERNATSVENAAYAVFPWNDGWAYEVHEGGPFRAYLPAILRFFDAQNDTRLDELAVTITTARRSVRVERTHTGLAGFILPESSQDEQTEWLEPGPRLKPAVPVRLGVLAAGGAIFGTGFLAMLVAMMLRPEAPVITAARQDIPYDQLPISLWPTLLKASATGYVNALQFSNGKYTFSIAGQRNSAESVTTPPPPLPAPLAKK